MLDLPPFILLSQARTSSLDISSAAQSIMRRIWEATGETVALSVPQGIDRLCVAEMPSAQPLSFTRGVGYRERLVSGASGRAILAFRDQDRDQIKALAQGLGEYEKKLERTRQLGYATSREELIAGAVAIAAPFFDGSDQAAGSLSVFGPSVRLSDEKVDQIGQLLKHECEALSLALGFRRQ